MSSPQKTTARRKASITARKATRTAATTSAPPRRSGSAPTGPAPTGRTLRGPCSPSPIGQSRKRPGSEAENVRRRGHHRLACELARAVPAGRVPLGGRCIPLAAAGAALDVVGGDVRVVCDAFGHELLIGALLPVDDAGVVAHVALGEEVVAFAEPLRRQLRTFAELDQVMEARFQLGEAAVLLTAVVVDPDPGVEARLAVVVECDLRVAGDEPVDRL